MRSLAGLPPFAWIAPLCLLVGAAALVQVGVAAGGAEGASARERAERALTGRVAGETAQAAERLRRIVADTRERGVFTDVPFPIETVGVPWAPTRRPVRDDAAFEAAHRLEFVAGDGPGALAEYARLAADPSSAVAGAALRERARLLDRAGRRNEAIAELRRAADLPDAPARDVLFARLDLARAGETGAGDALRRDLLTDRFATVDPQDRLLAVGEVAPDDPQFAGLRALAVLQDRADAATVVSVGPATVAWALERTAGTSRIALAPLAEFAAGLVPAVSEGLVVAAARGGPAKSPPLPDLAFLPTARARAGFDEAASRAARARSDPAFALAAVLAAGALVTFLHARARAALERQKDAFLCAVTHELKTPIANVLLYSETLREHGAADPERIPEFTGVIASEALRLEARVGELLDVASGRAGPPRGDERFDAAAVVRDVAAEFAGRAASHGVTFASRITADAAPVRGASRTLRRAFAALLDNAFVHAPRGAVRLEAARDGGRLRVVVEDEGPGIPAAERERVFAPFVRLGDERTRAVPGTGLGLTLARQGVEACGGTVRAEGREGGPGTRFVVEIPEA